VQANTYIPAPTPFIASLTAIIPAIAPAPTIAPYTVGAVRPSMSAQVRQGTTTVEAQEGQPSIGLMAPKPDATQRMDQWTEKILIIAGSIGMLHGIKLADPRLIICSWSTYPPIHHFGHPSMATRKETIQ
jgi:hypothetical protein